MHGERGWIGSLEKGMADWEITGAETRASRTVQVCAIPYYMEVQARETVVLLDFYMWIGLVSTAWDWWEALQLKCTAGIVSAQVHVACHATKPKPRKLDLKIKVPSPYHESGLPYSISRIVKLSAVGRAYQ